MFYLHHSQKQYSTNSFLVRLFISILVGLISIKSFALSSIPTIAITQIVGHEALDKVRQGVIDELKKNGYENGKTARILFENAQGNAVIAVQIAQHFVAEQPDVIVAIATPSAQAVKNAAKKTNIPIVFATITDPIQAKLVDNLKKPGKNITGTRNVSPIGQQIALIKQVLPQIKSLGVMLNYGEANSAQLLPEIIKNAEQLNINVKVASAASAAEVYSATHSLMGKVDAIFLMQDNTIASALPSVIKITQKNQIPVFTAYLDGVKAGALAGLAFDEYDIGKQTGEMVVKILRGEKAGNIAVSDPQNIKLTFNMTTAKKINIHLDSSLLAKAKHIYQNERNIS